MSTVRLGILIASVAILVGCGEAHLNVESTPPTPTKIRVPTADGFTAPIWISEMCYDGAVYLVSTNGGISPKIDPDHARGTTMGWSGSSFVTCDTKKQ